MGTTSGYGDGVTGVGVEDTTVNVGEDFFVVGGAEETVGGTDVGGAEETVGGTYTGGVGGGNNPPVRGGVGGAV
jgi:hypothetical protein